MSELFPLRIVTGNRFCNRKRERSLLKTFVTEKRPVVLISPSAKDPYAVFKLKL